MNKKSFVIYQNSQKIVAKLSDEQAGILFKNLFRHNSDEELFEMDSVTDVVFTCIQDYIDNDSKKYNARCEKNRENINKRWKNNNSKSYERIEKDTNVESGKFSNYDIESDIDIDTDIDNRECDINKKHAHGEYQNVFLTDAELESLKKDYPDYQKKIDYLSSYMEEQGKTYRNHFAVIKRWDREDKAKQSTANNGNKFSTSEASVTDYASIEELLIRN